MSALVRLALTNHMFSGDKNIFLHSFKATGFQESVICFLYIIYFSIAYWNVPISLIQACKSNYSACYLLSPLLNKKKSSKKCRLPFDSIFSFKPLMKLQFLQIHHFLVFNSRKITFEKKNKISNSKECLRLHQVNIN